MGIWQAINRHVVRVTVKWMLLLFGFILEFVVTLPFAMACRFDSATRRRRRENRVGRPETPGTPAVGDPENPA